jgi:hypothetical protein
LSTIDCQIGFTHDEEVSTHDEELTAQLAVLASSHLHTAVNCGCMSVQHRKCHNSVKCSPVCSWAQSQYLLHEQNRLHIFSADVKRKISAVLP